MMNFALLRGFNDELSKIATNKDWLKKIRKAAASEEGNTPVSLMKLGNPFMKALPTSLKAAKKKVMGRAQGFLEKGVAGGSKGGYKRVKPPTPKPKSSLSLRDPWFK